MNPSDKAVKSRQYYQQGVAFLSRGDTVNAADALSRAVQITPDHVDARIALSRAHQRRFRAQEGLDVLDAGLCRQGLTKQQRRDLLERAAECAAETGDYPVAQKYLESALKEASGDPPELINKLGALYCKGGEYKQGLDCFLGAERKG